MPALVGAWKDRAQSIALAGPLHIADPRHEQPGHEADPGDYAHQAPPYPYTMPLGREDFGSERVPDIRGQVLDNTPPDHDDGADWGIAFTRAADYDEPGGADWDILRHTHATHGLDRGSSRKQNYSTPTFRFYDERYLSFRIPGHGSEVGDIIPPESGGGQRGLNSLSVNNPPNSSYLGQGFWPGNTEQFVVDRKFQARVIQRNDERAQTLNLPYFEPNAPPPRPGNQSTTPFNALQRMVRSVSKIPLRRETPPLPGDELAERTLPDTDSPTVGTGFYG